MIENEINRSKVYGSGEGALSEKSLDECKHDHPTAKRVDNSVRVVLTTLQRQIGAANGAKGFHAEGDRLRQECRLSTARTHSHAALRNYYMVKIGLIMTEAAEGLEDLRNGRPVDRNYYTIYGNEVQKEYLAEHDPVSWVAVDLTASWSG